MVGMGSDETTVEPAGNGGIGRVPNGVGESA
jgi:hypothetical protein